jgi:hypothetical protein
MLGHSLQVMYVYDADVVGVTVSTDCEVDSIYVSSEKAKERKKETRLDTHAEERDLSTLPSNLLAGQQKVSCHPEYQRQMADSPQWKGRTRESTFHMTGHRQRL